MSDDTNQDIITSENIKQSDINMDDMKLIDDMEFGSNKTTESEIPTTFQNENENANNDFTPHLPLPLDKNISGDIEPEQDKVIPESDKKIDDSKTDVDNMEIDLTKPTISEMSDTNQKQNSNAKNDEMELVPNSVLPINKNLSADNELHKDEVIHESDKKMDDSKTDVDNMEHDLTKPTLSEMSDTNQKENLNAKYDETEFTPNSLDNNMTGDIESNQDKVIPDSDKKIDDSKTNLDNMDVNWTEPTISEISDTKQKENSKAKNDETEFRSNSVLPLDKNTSGDIESNQDKVIPESEKKVDDLKSNLDNMEFDSKKTTIPEISDSNQKENLNAKSNEIDFTSNSVLPLDKNMSGDIESNQDKVIPESEKKVDDLKSNLDNMEFDSKKTTIPEISDSNQKENLNAKSNEIEFTSNSVLQLDKNMSGDIESNQDKIIPASGKKMDGLQSNLDNMEFDLIRPKVSDISESNQDKVILASGKKMDCLQSNIDNMEFDLTKPTVSDISESNQDKVIPDSDKRMDDLQSNLDKMECDLTKPTVSEISESNQDKVIPESDKIMDDLQSNLDKMECDLIKPTVCEISESNQDKFVPESDKRMDDLQSNLDNMEFDLTKPTVSEISESNQDKVIPESDKRMDDLQSNLDTMEFDLTKPTVSEISESNQDKVIPESDKRMDDLQSNLDKMECDLIKPTLCEISESNQDKFVPESDKKMDDLQSNLNNDEFDSMKTTVSEISDTNQKESNLISAENSKIVKDNTTDIQNQPSTSSNVLEMINMEKQVDLDISDEIPEVDDSLGLLAESSRTVEEDDDQDDDEDDDDDEQDEESESNHRTPEFSEDSNAQTSEDKESEKQTENALDSFAYGLRVEPMETNVDVDVDNTVSGTVAADHDMTEDENRVPDKEGNEETPQIVNVTTERIQEKSDVPVDQVENLVAGTDADKIADAPADKIAEPSLLRSALTVVPEGVGSSQKNVTNIVDLEDSSSEDDIGERSSTEVTSVNLPKEIDVIMSTSCGNSSDLISKDNETIISGVPKPAPPKIARLNTGEVSIKTTNSPNESTLVIPEAKSPEAEERSLSPPRKGKVPYKKPKFSLEVFSLDSEEEDNDSAAADSIPAAPKKLSAVELQKLISSSNKCMNHQCVSGPEVRYHRAPGFAFSYYGLKKRKRTEYICDVCFEKVYRRMKGMMDGARDMTPLLQIDTEKDCQELVEISDSDSDSDTEEPVCSADEIVGVAGAEFLRENMVNTLNEIWVKYKFDDRLKSAKEELDEEFLKLEKDNAEIDALIKECQTSTDKLRSDINETFREETIEMPEIDIMDMEEETYIADEVLSDDSEMSRRSSKRQRKLVNYNESVVVDDANNQDAIPSVDGETQDNNSHMKEDEGASASAAQEEADDNADISVVKLSAEVAPEGLPPNGELERPLLKVGDSAYVLRVNAGTWSKGKILEVIPRPANAASTIFSVFKVRLERSQKGPWIRQVNGRFVAYPEPATVRLAIGTRVVALVKDTFNKNKRESFYSGIVAEMPTPVNNYRYLVFFDDGYAQYVQHANARVVCECSPRVWEDVHHDSREFVRKYLISYPERPMVRLHAGQQLKTEWNGKWWISRVVSVDASLAQVHFSADDRNEWIYRGSTRLAPLFLELQAAERRSNQRTRPVPRSNKPQNSTMNLPYVEYLRSDEQDNRPTEVQINQQNEEYRRQQRQRAVAKKSTAQMQYPGAAQPQPQAPLDGILSRVVYYTPKAAVKPHKMTPHTCGPRCKRTDVLPLKELRTYNPLARPLLSGWERQVHRFKGRKIVMYRAPCGRRLRDLPELHQYLRAVHSDMSVDLFDYGPSTHCLAEFVLNRCNVSKKDLSHGKESVPIPCVNYYDNSLPEFCSYSTERTPTTGVPLNTDPDFLCGCDCTDDCQDKSKCACWKMTLEGAKTIGMEGEDVGYVYKRLMQQLQTGIYECNVKCKCSHTCLNRVAQHPLQLKLQVFKTQNKGWGIRALNDVPKGAFLCVYAGNLLTDATANLDGINEGDEYLAELDYIEIVEKIKEGYESDVPDQDKRLDKKESDGNTSEDENEMDESSEDERGADKADYDFRPAVDVGSVATEFKKSLRKRVKRKDAKQTESEQDGAQGEKEKEGTGEDECITISDDEEVREPSRFTAQSGFDDDDFVPKHRSVRSYFGKDEACYIMDAKVQGNIGRYLNHSCSPNVFVQNVFVDTHDPRFPWVAFFASCHIRAGTELTWNYSYDIGSVPDKVLYCRCGAPNCRGRLL